MFGDIRSILEGPRDAIAWERLCRLLEAALAEDEQRLTEELLPHVREALQSWEDATLECPAAWAPSYFDDEAGRAGPLLELPRSLTIGPREARLAEQSEALSEELSDHVASLRRLRLELDYYHNDGLTELLDALDERAEIVELVVHDPRHVDMDAMTASTLTAQVPRMTLTEASYADLPIGAEAPRWRALCADTPLNLKGLFDHEDLRLEELRASSYREEDEALELARGLEGLRALATYEAPLDEVFAEEGLAVEELDVHQMLMPRDLDHLCEAPGLQGLRVLRAELARPTLEALLTRQRDGALPELERVEYRRNIHTEDSEPELHASLAHTGSPMSYLSKVFARPIERGVMVRTEGTWRHEEALISPFDVVDLDTFELAPARLEELLEGLAQAPPRLLRVASPHPEITRRLLEWEDLAQVRELVLLCDTLQGDMEWGGDLDLPYRIEEQDIEMLAHSEALAQIERLHLRLPFTRDDRWRKKHLSELPSIPSLHTLDLSMCELLDADLKRLCKSDLFEGVVRLSLRANRCTNATSSLFWGDSERLASLEHLDLSHIEGLEDTLYKLSDCEHMRRLEMIDMRHTSAHIFGENIEPRYFGHEALPSLRAILTDYYYFEIME